MVILQLGYLPLSQVEEAIVEIWNCVEEYRFPSPSLRLDFRGRNLAKMGLGTEDRVLLSILSARLSNWLVTSGAHVSAYLRLNGDVSVSALTALAQPTSGFRRP